MWCSINHSCNAVGTHVINSIQLLDDAFHCICYFAIGAFVTDLCSNIYLIIYCWTINTLDVK